MIDKLMNDSPCYVFNEEGFMSNIDKFKNALNNNFSQYDVSYSVKTNQNDYVIKTAYNNGCMIEVTSNDEYDLAVSLGVNKNRIVYNGPSKNKDTFIDAVNNDAIVNIECKREIEWLKECIKGKKVGIRLNVDLNRLNNSFVFKEEEKSRFGFSYEDNELKNAIMDINKNGYIVSGLHVHRTTKSRHHSIYRDIVKYATNCISNLNLHIDYLDVGGGYYGAVENKPSFIDYSNAIKEGLNGSANIRVIVEPGSAVIAAFMEFQTSVIDVKNIEGERYIVLDGSRIDIDPFFLKKQYEYEILQMKECEIVINKQVICGCTCLEKDILFEINNSKQINIGDILVFKRVGAYTMTLTPDFIRSKPAIYVERDGKYIMIRKRGDYKAWVANSVC